MGLRVGMAWWVGCLAAASSGAQRQQAHLGIDFGSEFLKLAMEVTDGADCRDVSPQPARCRGFAPRADPVVLTLAGSRKTPAAVRLRDESLFFGVDALSTQLRHPALTFVHPKQMLGWSASQAGQATGGTMALGGSAWFEQAGIRWFSFLADEGRGTLRVTSCCPHVCISAEELVGLLLAHVLDDTSATLAEERGEALAGREMAEQALVMLTVPPWWARRQRQALHDAATVAGLLHVELVEGPTALAFKFLLDYSPFYEQPLLPELRALLIDIGASGSTASVVSLRRSATEGKQYRRYGCVYN